MSIGIIIQARMTSRRLPGKVLRSLAGKPMLGWLLESLLRCGRPVAVATSVDSSDDSVEDFCKVRGVRCVRGPLDDVAARFALAAGELGCDGFVRICGDSPLLDHRLVSRAVELYRRGGADLVTNVHPRAFPKGQSVEVVSVKVFEAARRRMSRPEHLEHVTLYFYDHAKDYCIVHFDSGKPSVDLQMSVDTAEDFARAEAVIASLDQPLWHYTWKELAERMQGPESEAAC